VGEFLQISFDAVGNMERSNTLFSKSWHGISFQTRGIDANLQLAHDDLGFWNGGIW
jgi:hypothetical protein